MKKIAFLCFILILSACKIDQVDEEILFDVKIESSEGGTVNTSGGSYPIDTQLEITATPDANFEFTGWSGNASGSENPLSYIVKGNATITANFSQLVTYSLTVSSTEGGSVNNVNSKYTEGTSIELIAEPDNGYEFISWTIDGTVVSSDSVFEFIVKSDVLLVANFREIISINFADSNVLPDVNGFNASTDLIIQGNAEIISRGIYLDGQIVTDDSNQNDGITININDLSIQEYIVVFYVQTPNEFIESEEFTVTPYEAGYNFDNLNHTLNNATTVVDLFVQYGQKSPLADIEVIDEGFLISTKKSSLENSRVSVEVNNKTLNKQIDNIESSSTYYYQAFVENKYGLFKSEIISFNTKAVLGDLGQGGIIVEVDVSGFHGKVVAITDYWVKKQWSTEKCVAPDFKVFNNDKGGEITNKIIDFYSDKTASAPAAEYCYSLEIDGFDDWYLPNLEEINDAQYFLARNGYKQQILASDGVWTCKNLIEVGDNVCRAQTSVYNNSNGINPTARDAERYVIPMREF